MQTTGLAHAVLVWVFLRGWVHAETGINSSLSGETGLSLRTGAFTTSPPVQHDERLAGHLLVSASS